MNFGQGAINYVPKEKPAGPPFVATSAENGLSVDPGNGRIVLGNNIPGSAANLLSARQIRLSGFSLNLLGANLVADSSNMTVTQEAFWVFSESTNTPAGQDNTRKAFQALMPQLGLGGHNVMFVAGTDLTNCIEFGQNTGTTTGYRSGSYINGRGAVGGVLNLSCNGNMSFFTNDNDPAVATLRARIFGGTGNFRIGNNNTDNGAMLQIRLATGASFLNFETNAGAQALLFSGTGQMRLGLGSITPSMFTIRGASINNLLDLETSAALNIFSVSASGVISLAALGAAVAGSTVMVRNAGAGNQAVRGITGVSASIVIPAVATITVTDGIITAVV